MIPRDVKFVSLMNPGLFINNGKTYVVPGWHEVPNGTTLEEVKKHWVKKTYGEPTITPDSYVVEIVKSKRTGEKYRVAFEKFWTCTCVGYGFRRNCKHVKLVSEYINKNELSKTSRQSNI